MTECKCAVTFLSTISLSVHASVSTIICDFYFDLQISEIYICIYAYM